jgi:hypothetical protein
MGSWTFDVRSQDAPANPGGAVTQYVDPMQQTALAFGARSHWLQPWRAYLDTVPSLTCYCNKGPVRFYFFAAKDNNPIGLSLMGQPFFEYLKSHDNRPPSDDALA